jgi:hypothetical protein
VEQRRKKRKKKGEKVGHATLVEEIRKKNKEKVKRHYRK